MDDKAFIFAFIGFFVGCLMVVAGFVVTIIFVLPTPCKTETIQYKEQSLCEIYSNNTYPDLTVNHYNYTVTPTGTTYIFGKKPKITYDTTNSSHKMTDTMYESFPMRVQKNTQIAFRVIVNQPVDVEIIVQSGSGSSKSGSSIPYKKEGTSSFSDSYTLKEDASSARLVISGLDDFSGTLDLFVSQPIFDLKSTKYIDMCKDEKCVWDLTDEKYMAKNLWVVTVNEGNDPFYSETFFYDAPTGWIIGVVLMVVGFVGGCAAIVLGFVFGA